MGKKSLWDSRIKRSYWLDEEPVAVVVEEPEGLDFAEITRTLSTIREWLESEKPSQESAMDVFQYELKNANRSGAVGDGGCLTEYLEN